ncbi:hypothetical protein Aph02nite_17260 [Actinoplanes philippinensis]|uniref:Uncharacterized protein n=1 Tax=Actinoplanes philippinensis TaxID=35752 RepID=A0A1I2B9S4_9ACTN|nr:hypothetical protein [Actinoplanes philippinensis]GIE75776.1 hypothetical protein Aph02nite_17260 [Actinoplanes philippinensis]SFE52819.1 hypothetical protein SAMN05421541_102190 [Actinoplanes philippinensis]
MGESITTRLDEPYNQQPETRAAAVRVLTRTGNADLIEILGLDDTPPPPDPVRTGINMGGGSLRCSKCRQRTRADGICRRKTRCGESS